MNLHEELAIDSGGYLCRNSLCALTSQRSGDGV